MFSMLLAWNLEILNEIKYKLKKYIYFFIEKIIKIATTTTTATTTKTPSELFNNFQKHLGYVIPNHFQQSD